MSFVRVRTGVRSTGAFGFTVRIERTRRMGGRERLHDLDKLGVAAGPVPPMPVVNLGWRLSSSAARAQEPGDLTDTGEETPRRMWPVLADVLRERCLWRRSPPTTEPCSPERST